MRTGKEDVALLSDMARLETDIADITGQIEQIHAEMEEPVSTHDWYQLDELHSKALASLWDKRRALLEVYERWYTKDSTQEPLRKD